MTSENSPRVRRFGGLYVDLSPLKVSAAFRSLLFGQVVSLIGTQMRYVALAWQVFSITGSSAAVGLLGLAEVVPMLLLSVHAGALADARNRKTIMAWSQCAAMLISVLLFLLALSDDPSLWMIYALTALGASADTLDRPARTAIIPSLVGTENIPAAMALRQLTFQLSNVAGPAFGGLAIASFSIAAVYAIDAATFVASLASLWAVPRMLPAAEKRSARGLVREGLKASIGRPLIRSVFMVDLVAMVFGMPRAVFPALAESLGIGARGAGLLYAAPSVGALFGALFSGWVDRIRRYGRAIFFVVAIWGGAITFAGIFAFSLPLLLLFLAFAGAADVLSAVFRGTLVQEATPDHLRGRVTAVNMLVFAGGPRAGDVEAGLVAAAIGARGSIVAGGVLCLAGLGILALFETELRDYVRPRTRTTAREEGGDDA